MLPYRNPAEEGPDDPGPSRRAALGHALGVAVVEFLVSVLCLAIFMGYLNLRGCTSH